MANFVNIQNSATIFTPPLPFQHFTGDYSSAKQLTPALTGITSANQCDAVCNSIQECEFFKFTTTCNLFNSGSSTVLSGIKINSSLRGVGMSNIYSTQIPNTTAKTGTPSSASVSAADCETACNTDSTCFVYGYNLTTQTCSLYGSANTSGNVGSSRDLLEGIPTITLNTPTQVLKTIVFKGNASSTVLGNIEITRTGLDQVLASGTVADFTGPGLVYSNPTGTPSFSFTAWYALRQGITSTPVTFTYAPPTLTASNPTGINGKGLSFTVTSTNVPAGTPLVMFIGTGTTPYTLTNTSGTTTWSYTQSKRIWDAGTTQSIFVAVASDTTIKSTTALSVSVPQPIYATPSPATVSFTVGGVSTKYVLHTFTASGTFTPIANIPYDVLIVGGGGGGGGTQGTGGIRGCGGGGGGGVLELLNQTPSAATPISVSIGSRGAGGVAVTTGAGSTGSTGSTGGTTSFGSNQAPGGGGGSGNVNTNGGNGGNTVTPSKSSGGGASHAATSVAGRTGSNPTVYTDPKGNNGASGFDGGTGGTPVKGFYGGGGGGAGGPGQVGIIITLNVANNIAADGGPGYLPAIPYSTSVSRFGAGGGGGLNNNTGSATQVYKLSSGGAGGGGAGGVTFGTSVTAAGHASATGYGCGGGGAAANGAPISGRNGGNGSAGIVIVRYKYEDLA